MNFTLDIGNYVQLDIKVWENDYRRILSPKYLEKIIYLTSMPPSNIRIFINNVWSRKQAVKMAQRAEALNLIGDFVYVDDIAEQTLDFYGLSKQSLGNGYRYSICELAGIYLCQKKYTMHFSGDSIPIQKISLDYYMQSIHLLETNKNVKVTNLMWNEDKVEHESQSHNKDGIFWYSRGGFSDQMYFVSTSEFRAKIYDYEHEKSMRYPISAGNLFEKRVDAWMQNNYFERATYMHNSYCHRNFQRRLSSRVLRKLRGTHS